MGGSKIIAVIHAVITLLWFFTWFLINLILWYFYNSWDLLPNTLFDPYFLNHHFLFHPLVGYISAPFPKHIIYFHVSQPLLMPCLCLECPPPTFLSGRTLVHWWGSNSDVTCFFTDHPNPLSHSCLWPPLPPLFLLIPLFSIYHTALLLPICCYLYTCILWIL